ncbi:peptidase family M48-domain-containing protein [Limtongia smithiae]|uniref:peptidase family M48-domain-containing protein n=1 Tax=Limtongia smithiae TaxID=1125753 RepID=UPI0034CF9F9C
MLFGPKIEEMLGAQQYKSMLAEYRNRLMPENHPDAIRVRRVMTRLIEVSGLPELDWKIHVIADNREPPNAFVLPGGKVFVFSRILPICANDDGLATVLSHETAHQVARHSGEKLSQQPFYMIAAMAAWLLTGSSSIANTFMSLLFEMPSSRQMESEADYIGLLMMSQACFNPQEAVPFWGRMEKMAGGEQIEFLSTHPSSQRRQEQMQEWMPKALEARAAAGCDNGQDLFGFYNHLQRTSDSLFGN